MNFDDDPLVFSYPVVVFTGLITFTYGIHCVKNVHIRRPSGPYFPLFALNTERYGVSLHIQSKLRENTDQKISEYEHFSRNDYNLSYRISKQTYIIYFSTIQNEL